MSLASLDANVLLRLSLQDLPDQHELARRLVSGAPNRFVVGHIALNEYIFALQTHYKFSRPQIATMVREVLGLPTIVGDYKVVLSALTVYETHPKLSFPDCYLAEEAASLNAIPLWTFDKKLALQHEAAQRVSATP